MRTVHLSKEMSMWIIFLLFFSRSILKYKLGDDSKYLFLLMEKKEFIFLNVNVGDYRTPQLSSLFVNPTNLNTIH